MGDSLSIDGFDLKRVFGPLHSIHVVREGCDDFVEGILRTVESAMMATGSPLGLYKRLFYILMAIGCHGGEFAFAILSPILHVPLYVGIVYVSL
jgi:hypothetical protein